MPHVNPAHPHIPIFHHAMLFLPKHSFHRFITHTLKMDLMMASFAI